MTTIDAIARVLADQDREIRELRATLDRVTAVVEEWGEPYHCGWLSASVLVRQMRQALHHDKENRT